MRRLKIVIGLVLITAAGIAGFALTGTMLVPHPEPAQAAQGEAALAVAIVSPRKMAFTDTIHAVGTTRAIRAVELHPDAAGRVVELAISPGARVTERDLLLRLDDGTARATLKSAEATLTEARAAAERQNRLHESGNVSEATHLAAQAALQRAGAERDLAREALENRRLRAPFEGVVGLSDLTEGEFVDTTTIVTTLDDLSVIEVDFQVPEQAYPELHPGLGVELRSAAWPDRIFRGGISALDTRIDAGTRSLALRARIDNADGALRAGMFMDVTIVLDSHERPAVPERALTVEGPRTTIFTVEDGVARQVEIETGQSRDGLVEVTSGLDSADEVVVNNLHRLSDGMAVAPQPAMGADLAKARL